MTHEQFVWWLEGFLDGGADMDLDVRSQIREKLESIGAAPAQKQPAADKPKTPISLGEYMPGIGVGIASPGVAAPVGGWHSGGGGGFLGGAHTLGIADPRTTVTCLNSAASTDAAAASVSSAMANISAAARACT
jgi:hypothetical protein